MDEIGFRSWLSNSNKNPKVQSDTISRLKTIQRELGNIDIDEEYVKDKCERLLSAFSNKGLNEIMAGYGKVKLPIGKYTLSTYRYALNMYIQFLKNE